jgi:hypothetical protein
MTDEAWGREKARLSEEYDLDQESLDFLAGVFKRGCRSGAAIKFCLDPEEP